MTLGNSSRTDHRLRFYTITSPDVLPALQILATQERNAHIGACM